MSYKHPNGFLELLDGEAKAQGITEEELYTSFKEDFPQGYFMVFEEEKHIETATKAELDMARALFLGYVTGYVRRGAT